MTRKKLQEFYDNKSSPQEIKQDKQKLHTKDIAETTAFHFFSETTRVRQYKQLDKLPQVHIK